MRSLGNRWPSSLGNWPKAQRVRPDRMAINTINAGVIAERETAFLCLNKTGGSSCYSLRSPLSPSRFIQATYHIRPVWAE